MIVVSDTSAINNLAAIGQLILLKQLYGTVIIPEAVYGELVVPPISAALSQPVVRKLQVTAEFKWGYLSDRTIVDEFLTPSSMSYSNLRSRLIASP